ncbi:Baculoviral IAP repeat-containing protein 2 [Binucleata daphniae]
MTSFESRLNTFINFLPATISKTDFASCMFQAESVTSCHCIFCKKNLDLWDDGDVPIKEHFTHQNNCPIFNLNTYDARELTYPHTFMNPQNLIKQGFFHYRIKEKSRYDLFCFRCGFYVNENMNLQNDNIQNHYKYCKRTKRNQNFNFENKHGLFYIDLILGRYGKSFEFYCTQNVYIPDKMKETFKEVLSGENDFFIFEETGVVMTKKYAMFIKDCEKLLNDEINSVMDEVERKFNDLIVNVVEDE